MFHMRTKKAFELACLQNLLFLEFLNQSKTSPFRNWSLDVICLKAFSMLKTNGNAKYERKMSNVQSV